MHNSWLPFINHLHTQALTRNSAPFEAPVPQQQPTWHTDGPDVRGLHVILTASLDPLVLPDGHLQRPFQGVGLAHQVGSLSLDHIDQSKRNCIDHILHLTEDSPA